MVSKHTAEQKTVQLADSLVRLCHEHGVFPPEVGICGPKDDLLEGGLIDSMSLIYLQAVIQETYSIEIEPELFIAELRNIHAIAAYIVRTLPVDRIENTLCDAC